MRTNWPACYAAFRRYEGGNDDDPRDPGGRTSRGILQREWTRYVAAHPGQNLPADVWEAPESAIEDIYRTSYWNVVQGDYWPAGCDFTVADAGVNSGISRSMSWAASCLNGSKNWPALTTAATALPDKTTFIHDFYAKRLSFLHGLRTFVTFGYGWTTRCTTGEALACKMAGASSAALQQKAKDARKAAHTAGGSAAGTTAAGSLASSLTDHPVLLALLGAVVVGALAYSAWYWYVHHARATAMEGIVNAT